MEEKLIEEIEKHKYLYDKRHKQYKNNKIKADAWMKISEVMNIPVSKIQSRWKTLREQYVKALRSTRNPSGSGVNEYPPKFKHFERLNFLKDSYTPRKTFSNLDFDHELNIFEDEEFDDDMAIDLLNVNDTSDSTNHINSSVHVPASLSRTSRTSTPARDFGDSQFCSFLKKLLPEQSTPNDHIHHFMLSLGDSIRQAKFSQIEFLDLQLKLINVVQNKLKEKEQQNTFLN